MIDFVALRELVLANRIIDSALHGLAHWRQVESNGLLLAPATGADVTVVRLFAVFHDCQRQDDGTDAGHGPRGAAFAKRCFANGLLDIKPEQFAQLHHACEFHTAEFRSGNATIDTCYDADRLDMGRVGISPDPARMATVAGSEIARNSLCSEVAPREMREWLAGIRRRLLLREDCGKLAGVLFPAELPGKSAGQSAANPSGFAQPVRMRAQPGTEE